jgi:HAD superfamily hydrolase (TIGR01509 family)
MIKLIVFDLDGVLLSTKEIHYHALNQALASVDPRYCITFSEHLSVYDGLPTRKKLQLLTKEKGLPESMHDSIWKLKQEKTNEAILEKVKRDERLIGVLQSLKEKYKVYVASNAVRDAVGLMLDRTGLLDHVDRYLSNEDVKHPKPHSEIYLRCMIEAGVDPKECLIIEDSYFGRRSALASGAHLLGVDCPEDVTFNRIAAAIAAIEEDRFKMNTWTADDMVVLIPMAGAGSRFQQAGYTFPKPLIEVNGKPMIQVVVENLGIKAHYVFVVQKAHYEQYNLRYLLNLIAPNCDIVQVEGLTEGAACTSLLARHFIDNEKRLLLANSDQFIEWDSGEFVYSMIAGGYDGGILTFPATHPKWSFVRVDENNLVKEVAEKRPISNIANVGIYYWRRGSDFVKYTDQMIAKDVRTNGEFYVAPVYNEAIEDGKRIANYSIDKMWGLGDPESLVEFLTNYKVVS